MVGFEQLREIHKNSNTKVVLNMFEEKKLLVPYTRYQLEKLLKNWDKEKK